MSYAWPEAFSGRLGLRRQSGSGKERAARQRRPAIAAPRRFLDSWVVDWVAAGDHEKLGILYSLTSVFSSQYSIRHQMPE